MTISNYYFSQYFQKPGQGKTSQDLTGGPFWDKLYFSKEKEELYINDQDETGLARY